MADLIAEEIRKEYQAPGAPLTILNGVNLTVSRGESVAIVGPSGSGKSTLLAILGTLEPPTSGSVNLLGENPYLLAAAGLSTFRGANIGFVFQDHYLLPQLTALENVLIPFLAEGATTHEHQQWATQMLTRVGLAERAGHRPAELSGGERQRVAIARALIRKPALLLADEPTGNLDRSTADSIAQLLFELQLEQNSMLVCATHSGSLASHGDRIMELDAGRLAPL